MKKHGSYEPCEICGKTYGEHRFEDDACPQVPVHNGKFVSDTFKLSEHSVTAFKRQLNDKLQLAHSQIREEVMRYDFVKDKAPGFLAMRQGRLHTIAWILKVIDDMP